MEQSDHKYRKWLLDKSLWLLEQGISTADRFALIESLPGLLEVRKRLIAHADSNAVVLFRGPKGSGKTTIAEYSHKLGRRREKEMVRVNCATIPHELFEQYFFGRLKGSSTGADYSIPGHFKEASDSTLFLDEIGHLPLTQQAKLLVTVEHGRFRPIGATQDAYSNARVICATNRDLEQMVEDGTMWDDFHSRINDVVINIPPLSQRREDIPFYVRFFLHDLAKQRQIDCPRLRPEALELLLFDDWPDDVRGLLKVLRQAIYEFEGVITADLIRHLLELMGQRSKGRVNFYEDRCRWERQRIYSATVLSKGNDALTAQILGLQTKRQLTQLKARLGIRNSDILG